RFPGGTPIFAVSRRQFMKDPGLRSGRVSDFSEMSIMLSDQGNFTSAIPQPMFLAAETKLPRHGAG
ncbi:MAG: hypothetical protein ACWGP1_12755, partial [Syntrophobacteria bacterium]